MNPKNLIKRKFNKIEISILILLGISLGFIGIKGILIGVEAWKNRPVLCSTLDGTRVYNLLSDINARWDDGSKLAASTSRMNLSTRIADLQAIKRDLDKQEWPKCSQKAKKYLVEGMDSTIEGYISFLHTDEYGVSERLSSIQIETGNDFFKLFKGELEKLKMPQKPE
jgi:hypothetical protein